MKVEQVVSRCSSRSTANLETGYTAAERIRYWIVEERRLLLDAISGLAADVVREPLNFSDDDSWSVHDILAHLMFWEGCEYEAIDQYLRGKRVELLDFPIKRIDGTNAAAVETLRAQPTENILGYMRKTREALMEAMFKLDDEQLNSDESAAHLILGIALEHDREHRKEILVWRHRRAQQVLEDGISANGSQDRAVDPPRMDDRWH